MVVPDLGLICEIMLMAEGFQMSKILSRKFVILYKLCEDLLSKSKHYDWKLRAIKTTLYVAGGMKRAAPELTEDKVQCMRVALSSRHQCVSHVPSTLHASAPLLCISLARVVQRAPCLRILNTALPNLSVSTQVLLRALRDFNLGKLTSDDTSIFLGLLNDLFPKTLELVPRAVERDFEAKACRAHNADISTLSSQLFYSKNPMHNARHAKRGSHAVPDRYNYPCCMWHHSPTGQGGCH